MATTPYITAEYVPEEATCRHSVSQPVRQPTAAVAKKPSNWLSITAALNGLAVGILTANVAIPLPTADNDVAQSCGEVIGQGIGVMLFFGLGGWILSRAFPRWLRIVSIVFTSFTAICLGAIAALYLLMIFVVRIELPEIISSADFNFEKMANVTKTLEAKGVWGQNAEIPIESNRGQDAGMPVETGWELDATDPVQVDWSRHRTANRIAVASHPFSVELSRRWSLASIDEEEGSLHFKYSTLRGPQASLKLMVLPDYGRISGDRIVQEFEGEKQSSVEEFVILEEGTFRLDDKDALYFAGNTTLDGGSVRQTAYAASRGRAAYVALVTWHDPMSGEVRAAIENAIHSLRIE